VAKPCARSAASSVGAARSPGSRRRVRAHPPCLAFGRNVLCRGRRCLEGTGGDEVGHDSCRCAFRLGRRHRGQQVVRLELALGRREKMGPRHGYSSAARLRYDQDRHGGFEATVANLTAEQRRPAHASHRHASRRRRPRRDLPRACASLSTSPPARNPCSPLIFTSLRAARRFSGVPRSVLVLFGQRRMWRSPHDDEEVRGSKEGSGNT
jgi:hypothetical protein